MYTPGAVSSLINSENSSTEKSKEQKKLDKLFGWKKTTRSPVVPDPSAFSSASDVSKDVSLDFNPPNKKKKDLQHKNGDVNLLKVKNEFSSSSSPEKTLKAKKSTLKKDDEKKERKEKDLIKPPPLPLLYEKTKKLKEKTTTTTTENEDKKSRKRKKNSEEKKSDFFQNKIEEEKEEKKEENEFVPKKKKLKMNENNKIKKEKQVKKLSNNNNDINNNNVRGDEKAVKPQKVPVINDVLCALQGKQGFKSRKRNSTMKEKDLLSDLEEEEEEEEENEGNSRKRTKKKKRDKKKDFKTVFVGNLPLTITTKYLKRFFSSSCGEVESVRLRGAVPANPEKGKKYAVLKKEFHSKCKSINAYICFCDKESADKACETLNGQEIGGQFIRVNSSIIDKNRHDHKRSVFVGNLPFVVTEDDVRKHFLDCGAVDNIRLVKDWKTGIGKGFGYVKFQELDGAGLAVKLDGSKLCKRKIRVFPSEADPKKQREVVSETRGKSRKEKDNSRGGAGGGGGGGNVKNFEKVKLKKSEQKEFVGIKAEKKKKKKPKHLARKMGLAPKKKGVAPGVMVPVGKPVEKSTSGPNKHVVFE